MTHGYSHRLRTVPTLARPSAALWPGPSFIGTSSCEQGALLVEQPALPTCGPNCTTHSDYRLLSYPCLVFLVVFCTACLTGQRSRAQLPGPASPVSGSGLLATNLMQLRHWASAASPARGAVRLQGEVCAVNPARNLLVLRDSSGTELLHFERLAASVQPGQQLRVELEDCQIVKWHWGYGLHQPPLVDNDGIHSLVEKSGAVFLKAGLNPLRLTWFNGSGDRGLEVSYEGPGFPRQKVPESVLFQSLPVPTPSNTLAPPGLQWRCFEGEWEQLPDFSQLVPVRTGTTTNFDLSFSSRSNQVGLEFRGDLRVPRSGCYTFFIRSDDGSQLYVGELEPRWKITATGSPARPEPVDIETGAWAAEAPDSRWACIEGTLTFVSEQPDGLSLELQSGTERIHVEVAERGELPAPLLLNSHVRLVGVCQSGYTVAGRRRPGLLGVANARDIQLLELAPEVWTSYPLARVNQLPRSAPPSALESIVHLAGRLRAVRPDQSLTLEDETGLVAVEGLQPLSACAGARIEVLVNRIQTATNVVLRGGVYRELPDKAAGENLPLPQLTEAEQVQRLKREEAERGYPVKLRGVITCTAFFRGLVLQDATRGVFVDMAQQPGPGGPQVGEFWEIEGVSGPGLFAPMVELRQMRRLGQGYLPAPLQPTWDQLMSGSLDTQYVELQGIVTEVEGDKILLLTHGGKIKVSITGVPPNRLLGFENKLVRVRGCLLALWDAATHKVQVGEIQMGSASLSLEQPLLSDPFAVPAKTVPDLLLFDLRSSGFQRVKVSGQVLHGRQGEFFLTDGTNGLRFIGHATDHLAIGDLVEVVGIPDLGGPSPILREAAARKTGRARLPKAVALETDTLLRAEHDATLVRLEALLVNQSGTAAEQVLELQAGLRRFFARVNSRQPLGLQPGSRLQLTGVYAGQGGNPSVGKESDSFELLLNSPADIRILAQPPWWTLRRLIAVLGVMTLALLLVMLWVFTLQRQVLAQTKVIRQKVEREATLEERARIARELHDTLEQALAGISLQLNALSATLRQAPAEALRILEMARSMVRHGQEEARRTVQSLRLFATEGSDLPTALSRMAASLSSGLSIRIQVAVTGPPQHLPPKVESHLLRIGQEATTNALKHARPSLVELQLRYGPDCVQLVVRDDGCGFDITQGTPSDAGHFGLLGMRERAERARGTLEIRSCPGAGTTVQVTVPLANASPAANTQHEENHKHSHRG